MGSVAQRRGAYGGEYRGQGFTYVRVLEEERLKKLVKLEQKKLQAKSYGG
jgi:hypothetical protein